MQVTEKSRKKNFSNKFGSEKNSKVLVHYRDQMISGEINVNQVSQDFPVASSSTVNRKKPKTGRSKVNVPAASKAPSAAVSFKGSTSTYSRRGQHLKHGSQSKADAAKLNPLHGPVSISGLIYLNKHENNRGQFDNYDYANDSYKLMSGASQKNSIPTNILGGAKKVFGFNSTTKDQSSVNRRAFDGATLSNRQGPAILCSSRNHEQHDQALVM